MANPKILNLDELELEQSDISIVHEGVSHKMRPITVDMFIEQNKRAAEHQKLVEEGETDPEVGDVVEVMRNSIKEFFPTLPVGELLPVKMFTIFAWLNELSAKMNGQGADSIDAEDEEGNAD